MAKKSLNELIELFREFEVALIEGNVSDFDVNDLVNSCEDHVHNVKGLQTLLHIVQFTAKADYDNVVDISNEIHALKGLVFNADEDINGQLQIQLSQTDSDYVSNATILYVGVALLQEFVQCNWTGPSLGKEKLFGFVRGLLDMLKPADSTIVEMLSLNGQNIYSNVKSPELLYLSKMMLSSVSDVQCFTQKWWLLRSQMIHQNVLTERSSKLYEKVKEIIEPLLQSDKFCDKSLKTHLLIETGMAHLYYHEVTPAKKCFLNAQEIVGLKIEMSGAIGKRTQFQQDAVAQLCIRVQRGYTESKDCIQTKTIDMPSNCLLQDDVLLNKVKFMDESENVVERLLPIEQLVLLAQCCLLQRSCASDELLEEQLMTYVDYLLAQQNVWSLHIKMLIMRCKIERHRSRKMERAMMQLEALLAALKKDVPDVLVKQVMFHSVLFPPYWIIEKELADILIALGAVKTALEIYSRLELWDEVVACYQILDEKEKSAEIVRQQIEKKETATLWCILGDVTNDVECYQKAWDLSKHRNSRSQSSLGFFHYKDHNYEKCIPFFKKALDINYLQVNVWFALAFAATETLDHELASQAYRHVVNLDPDNFEAWNNLANAYIQSKQKVRAYRALQEALKCNYEHWRVWDNYLVVCIDIGAFEEAIQAYHRLLDLKKKHEDPEVLGIIVKAVTMDVSDFTGQPSSRLKKNVLQLFGRVTSIITHNCDIWKCYALLYSSDSEYTTKSETAEHVVRYLQKAMKCASQKPQWEKQALLCKSIISDAITLANAYVVYLKLATESEKSQSKSAAMMLLKNVSIRVEKQLQDFVQSDIEELKEMLSMLKKLLDQIEAM